MCVSPLLSFARPCLACRAGAVVCISLNPNACVLTVVAEEKSRKTGHMMASASTSLGCVGGVPLRGQGKQQKHLHGVLASQVVQTRARGRRRTTSLSLRRSCCLRSSLRYKQGGGTAGFLNGVGSQTVSYSWRLRATEGESKSESEQEVDKLIRDITSGTKPETTFSMFCLSSCYSSQPLNPLSLLFLSQHRGR